MWDYVLHNWLALALLVLAGAVAALRVARAPLWLGLALLAAGGVGVLPRDVAVWLAAGAALVLVAMLVAVIVSGEWWTSSAYAGAAVLLVGLGGTVLPVLTG